MGNPISQDSKRSRGTRSTRQFRRLFLDRLEGMVAFRRQQARIRVPGDPNLRLLDRAVYSTFCDCIDLGAGEEARAILRQEDAAMMGEGAREAASLDRGLS